MHLTFVYHPKIKKNKINAIAANLPYGKIFPVFRIYNYSIFTKGSYSIFKVEILILGAVKG